MFFINNQTLSRVKGSPEKR